MLWLLLLLLSAARINASSSLEAVTLEQAKQAGRNSCSLEKRTRSSCKTVGHQR